MTSDPNNKVNFQLQQSPVREISISAAKNWRIYYNFRSAVFCGYWKIVKFSRILCSVNFVKKGIILGPFGA